VSELPPIATAAHIVSSTLGFTGLLTGIDADALIGAFAGAALVVATSKHLSMFTRYTYMMISMIAGYQAAPEVVRLTPIRSTGLAAFLAAALAIAVTLQLIERVKTFDLRALFKKD
jgi:Putative phage holin